MNTNYQYITPKNLLAYAEASGWESPIEEGLKDGLYALSHKKYPKRQLVFPMKATVPDYSDIVQMILGKIAELEKKSISQVLAELNALNEDTVNFRLINAQNETQYIPFSYAIAVMNGAKDMLLSAAHSVLQAQAQHPRLNKKEPNQLLEAARFRHTEMGSFVLKVSCPLEAVHIKGSSFYGEYSENMPFVRQTSLTLNDSIADLTEAIESKQYKHFVDSLKTSEAPKISSNFCQAITNFQEENKGFDLSLGFAWGGALALPQQIKRRDIVTLKKDYFAQIAEIGTELKGAEKQNTEEVFLATVEKLAGEIGDDGKRLGEVILRLHSEEGIINARAYLDATQYAVANQAHMTAEQFIRVKGKLRIGKQPRALADITVFDLLKD